VSNSSQAGCSSNGTRLRRRTAAGTAFSFEEAATVFLDAHARVFADPDTGESESRFLLVGFSAARRTLVVVHVERGEHLRIVSPREATRRERRNFEEG
jgi:uncharacterized DUF497 family protein